MVVSVAHYGEQNSDLMRDPEMLFEVFETAGSVSFRLFNFRNDYIGIDHGAIRHLSATFISVSAHPGQTAFTRIPRPPHSAASARVKPIKPCLEAL
jgi:hypothetical protein